jgi:hypothetical protein
MLKINVHEKYLDLREIKSMWEWGFDKKFKNA